MERMTGGGTYGQTDQTGKQQLSHSSALAVVNVGRIFDDVCQTAEHIQVLQYASKAWPLLASRRSVLTTVYAVSLDCPGLGGLQPARRFKF
jgi:hypothetical protein